MFCLFQMPVSVERRFIERLFIQVNSRRIGNFSDMPASNRIRITICLQQNSLICSNSLSRASGTRIVHTLQIKQSVMNEWNLNKLYTDAFSNTCKTRSVNRWISIVTLTTPLHQERPPIYSFDYRRFTVPGLNIMRFVAKFTSIQVDRRLPRCEWPRNCHATGLRCIFGPVNRPVSTGVPASLLRYMTPISTVAHSQRTHQLPCGFFSSVWS